MSKSTKTSTSAKGLSSERKLIFQPFFRVCTQVASFKRYIEVRDVKAGAFFMTIASVLALSLATACTNNRMMKARSLSSTTTGDPLANVINDMTANQIILTRVIKNALNPTSTFDLIGDGSGAIGTKCVSANATDSGTSTTQGPSSCTCQYTYTKSDGSVESFEAPTSYHEANLARCLYVGIPAAVSSVKVRLHLTSTDAYSNEITFNFHGSGISLDTASELTFSKVLRFQCKQSIKVPYAFEPAAGKIYDPIQSEDPRNTYPLNFYTTNIGASYAYHAGGLAAATPAYDYYCPGIPNDPNEGMDLGVFSVSANSLNASGGAGGISNKQIYPPVPGSFDRSTFYLARQATSVFNVPVNSYVAPGIFSVAPDAQGNTNGLPPALGYGASPIPTGVQGQETCPDSSIQIPQGYRWVKIWLFRMALPARKFLSSVSLQQLNTIWCSPGEWSNDLPAVGEPTRAVFDPCYKIHRDRLSDGDPTNNETGATYLSDVGVGGVKLSSRFFEGTAMCVNVDPQKTTSFLATLGNPIPGPGRTSSAGSLSSSSLVAPYSSFNFPVGSDIWRENDLGANAKPGAPLDYSCRGSAKFDPAHICGAPVGTNNPGSVPYDDNLITGNIDDPSTPRFDYLFVVTPPSVMSGEMSSISSPTHYMYTPYRFMAPDDCTDTSGDGLIDPDADNCPASRALRNYGIKFHDVGGAGDPPADDPNRPGVFPVCALQKS